MAQDAGAIDSSHATDEQTETMMTEDRSAKRKRGQEVKEKTTSGKEEDAAPVVNDIASRHDDPGSVPSKTIRLDHPSDEDKAVGPMLMTPRAALEPASTRDGQGQDTASGDGRNITPDESGIKEDALRDDNPVNGTNPGGEQNSYRAPEGGAHLDNGRPGPAASHLRQVSHALAAPKKAPSGVGKIKSKDTVEKTVRTRQRDANRDPRKPARRLSTPSFAASVNVDPEQETFAGPQDGKVIGSVMQGRAVYVVINCGGERLPYYRSRRAVNNEAAKPLPRMTDQRIKDATKGAEINLLNEFQYQVSVGTASESRRAPTYFRHHTGDWITRSRLKSLVSKHNYDTFCTFIEEQQSRDWASFEEYRAKGYDPDTDELLTPEAAQARPWLVARAVGEGHHAPSGAVGRSRDRTTKQENLGMDSGTPG